MAKTAILPDGYALQDWKDYGNALAMQAERAWDYFVALEAAGDTNAFDYRYSLSLAMADFNSALQAGKWVDVTDALHRITSTVADYLELTNQN